MSSKLFGKGYEEKAEKVSDFSGKRTLDSNVYEGTVRMAFAGQSANGAAFVTLDILLDNGKTYKETIYVSNRDGDNTYVDKNKKIQYLPGFLTVNQLCLLGTGKDLFELEDTVETKTVKLYDFDVKAEVNTDVPSIEGLRGAKVLLAIVEYEEAKKAKQGNEYLPTGEIAIRNQIDKVYDLDTKQTYVEKVEGKEATQHDSWISYNKGKVRELKNKPTANANTTTLAKPTSSGLFGKKP